MLVLSLQWRLEGRSYTQSAKLESKVTIGRSPDCHITIAHPTVSRRHASVWAQGEEVIIQNLSQTNPVLVNERTLAHREQTTLAHGDTLQLGLITAAVSLPDLGPRVVFKVKCTGCGKVADSSVSDCPWCGTSLAFGETFIGGVRE